MVDVNTVNETSQEANWNRQTDRRTGAQDYILRQADTLTKKEVQSQNVLWLKSFMIAVGPFQKFLFGI